MVTFNAGAVPANWHLEGNGFYRNWAFSLSQLMNDQDFRNLFGQYRLTSASVSMFFSDTTSDDKNRQMIIYTKPNQPGQDTILTETQFLESQTTTKRMGLNTTGRPVKYWMPLKQLVQLWSSVTVTDYGLVTPKFISTAEPDTPHFGLDMRIQRVNDANFGTAITNYMTAKIIVKLYIECKQVQ